MNGYLFYNVNILLFAHILEYFWPDGGAHLANMGLFQEQHKCAGLADAPANAQRNLIVYDALMVGEL